MIQTEKFTQPGVNINEGILSDDSDGLLSDDDESSDEDEFGFGRVRGIAMDLKNVLEIKDEELEGDEPEEDPNSQFNIAFYNNQSDETKPGMIKESLLEEESVTENNPELYRKIVEEAYNRTISNNLEVLENLTNSC